MDIVTIQDVGTALAILASEVSEGTAREIGKDLWKKAKSVFTWSRPPEKLSPEEIKATVDEQLDQQPDLAPKLTDLLPQLTELLKESGHITTTTLTGKNVLTMDGVQVGGDFHFHAAAETAPANTAEATQSPAPDPEPIPESEVFPDREAGKPPAACLIPYSRNRNYQDREPSVDDLRKALREEGAAIVQAVHGQGGVGKTQLASEYVYCTAIDGTDYDVTWRGGWTADWPTTIARPIPPVCRRTARDSWANTSQYSVGPLNHETQFQQETNHFHRPACCSGCPAAGPYFNHRQFPAWANQWHTT